MKNQEGDSFFLLTFLNKNKLVLIGIPLLMSIVVLCLSMLMKPRYLSTAIVFPTSGSTIEHTIDNPNFGYDIEADRLLQIFQSSELADSIARKFDMVGYYGLDTTNNEWKDILNERIRKDLQFQRTPYMSIQISAITKDPEMSADMVNASLLIVDKIRDRIYKKNLFPAASTLLDEYRDQRVKVDSILVQLGKTKSTSRIFSMKQDKDGFVSIVVDQPADVIIAQLMNQYLLEQKRAQELLAKYDKIKSQLNRPTPSVYIVDRAKPSYKKVSPSLSKNVSIAFVGTLFLCMIVLYLRDEIRWNKHNE